MKKTVKYWMILVLLLLALPVKAQFQAWEGSAVLDDPEWRKSFLGSYGFLSGSEPEINENELELLREVIDVMKVNVPAAAAMLSQETGADSSASLDFILANLYFQNGNLNEASAAYESALKKFPDFRRAHKNFGLLKVQAGDCEAARPHLAKAVELGDRDGRNFGLIGYCAIQSEDFLTAETAYRNAIIQEPQTQDWKLGLARSLMATSQHKEAVAIFGGMIRSDPSDIKAWTLQANSYLSLERPEEAAVNLEAIRMMGKAGPETLILLGDIYMNSGMPGLAIGPYQEVIANDPDGVQWKTAQRAVDLLIRTGDLSEAGVLMEAAGVRYGEQLRGSDELAFLTLKARLARAQGDQEEGARLLELIVKRDGTRGDALLELASYHGQAGDDARAILLLERAANISGFEYKALVARAQILVQQRKYAEAASFLRDALEIKRESRIETFLAQVEAAAQ